MTVVLRETCIRRGALPSGRPPRPSRAGEMHSAARTPLSYWRSLANSCANLLREQLRLFAAAKLAASVDTSGVCAN